MRRRSSPHVMRWSMIVLMAGMAWLLWPASYGGATTLVVVSGSSMEPTYHTGDVLLMRETQPEVGDVIAFRVPGDNGEIVHRVVERRADGTLLTQGDNRDTPDLPLPTDADVVGVSVLLLPQGWWVLAVLTSPLVLGVGAAAIILARSLRLHVAQVAHG